MKARVLSNLLVLAGYLAFSSSCNPAFCQEEEQDINALDQQISLYKAQERAYEKSLQENLACENSDLKILARLMRINSKRNLPLENKILARVAYERKAIAMDEKVLKNIDGWISYDEGVKQREVAKIRQAQYNAEQDAIDQEVKRRNTYTPPTFSAGASLWGNSLRQDGYGYGYGGGWGWGGRGYHGGHRFGYHGGYSSGGRISSGGGHRSAAPGHH
jgi:hypothetical protein